MSDSVTPMMGQYRRIKGELPPGVILFFRLGEYERTIIVKAETKLMGNVSIFGFWVDESNPFPKLSAIQALSGAGSDPAPGGRRVGFGFRFRL